MTPPPAPQSDPENSSAEPAVTPGEGLIQDEYRPTIPGTPAVPVPRTLPPAPLQPPPTEQIRRRKLLPLMLFVATCASTFWVAAARWEPTAVLGNWKGMWLVATANWQQGVEYMGAVLAILVTHEMGHFLQTVRYGIPASYPLCIPLPINPFGTMGAVIGMDGTRANRREIFDIGIAGPLAGLIVAIPVMWFGVGQLNLDIPPEPDSIQLNNPWLVQWMIGQIHPQWAEKSAWIALSQITTNPLFMAGWVGLLITGLNMMPISQLDGGHTIYALFGKEADAIARSFTVFSILFVILYLDYAFIWTPMLVLVILLGIHHPPTADDTVTLGPIRRTIGYLSLGIPILCFPLLGFRT